ncbi:SSI family serine proteinase inhibitor [Streptomyces albipurpureus]|uniref:Subtilase-type protease inhibitor n=1 Tax=Streptomyces albipurpureus TaxID=2897419 RepID=A0ABT0US19_9ACTN|nr:SSI family serine proteinase inhibitor [Streptomyces sp. CWNU-1]MCM2391402.1 subtilase-type protease inhibitor [Streptomyces sp. CWNU-1]
MLRRLILTATASAAALVAAVPVAGATTLPFPLPLFSAPELDRLTVVVSETGNTRADGRYELKCDPAGGTHPAAERACTRLDELGQDGSDPFAPVPEGQMCTQQSGGPATARVTGTWRGNPVDAVFSRTDGCEISRWRTMEPVLPSTR